MITSDEPFKLHNNQKRAKKVVINSKKHHNFSLITRNFIKTICKMTSNEINNFAIKFLETTEVRNNSPLNLIY